MATTKSQDLNAFISQVPHYRRRPWLSATTTIVLFAVVTLLLHPYYISLPQPGPFTQQFRSHQDIVAPRKNVWSDLPDDIVVDLQNFLYQGPNELNLVTPESKSPGNSIYYIQALRPNKTDVLTYMNDCTQSTPAKWAHVVVDNGVYPHKTFDEYMIGPLPVNKETQITPLSYPYNSGRSSTTNPRPPKEDMEAWGISIIPEIIDILQGILGNDISFNNITNQHDLGVSVQMPTTETGRILSWCALSGTGKYAESSSLLLQGVYFQIDLSSADYADWKLLKWMYHEIVYNSTEEFRQAIKQAGFEKTPFNEDGNWTMTEDLGPGLKNREIPPPVMVQMTPRYAIDRSQKFVSWMGFEFYIAHSQISGLTLFDIRFKGDPIIYELGLQEAMAHYAGDDPMQGNLVFLDTLFNMGALMFELVPGYDCPAYASYLDTHWWKEGKKVTSKNSVCVFEYTADHPIQRHTASGYVSVSRNNYFIVRSVSTVGNYDYTIEYIFYLDGALEVKVRASGFIFSTFWTSGRSPEYGFRIHDRVASSIHTHVLNFKADVDIGGTQNSVVRIGVEPAAIDYPWDLKPARHTMHLTRQTVKEESGFNWPANTKETFFIGDNSSLNAWGEKRGYIMRPGTGMGAPIHLVIQNSTAIGKAVEFASMDFWITKQKDTEMKSTSPMNALEIHNPLIDFSRYIDGENIEQEDLVIYFNLGGHHIPHSGDLPSTLSHTSASSVIFLPHNFHDSDPSRQSSNGVRVDIKDRNNTKYFGGRNTKDLIVKVDEIEPDMNEYNAKEHEVRKMVGGLL